ncbi:MAG TPA: pyridoxamine 5'-phosphate oxidase family protein [Thermoanaerobaculia bacterium]
MPEKNDIEKIRDLIKGISFAMLTTVDEDGSLRSRPMQTQDTEFDGELWFFTGASSHKVDEVQRDRRVNLSYADPDDNRYVSLSGTAALVRDRAKMKELWKPVLKAWFPGGLEDPELALLRVKVEKAEYWDSPSSKMVQLAGFLKAIATGKRLEYAGENEKLELDPAGARNR